MGKEKWEVKKAALELALQTKFDTKNSTKERISKIGLFWKNDETIEHMYTN
jgi:hypothetical protein